MRETQCRRLAGTGVRQWRDVIWISQFHKRRFIWINEGSKLSLNLIWKLPTSLLSSSQRFNFSRKTFEVFIFLTEWEKRKYSLNKKKLTGGSRLQARRTCLALCTLSCWRWWVWKKCWNYFSIFRNIFQLTAAGGRKGRGRACWGGGWSCCRTGPWNIFIHLIHQSGARTGSLDPERTNPKWVDLKVFHNQQFLIRIILCRKFDL